MPSRRLVLGAALALPCLALPVSGQSVAIGIGRFSGASDHVTRGTGLLIRDGGTYAVQLDRDFFFDGAPDPKVALGRDGYDPATILGPLRKTEGLQVYPVPSRIDATAYNEIWIWCERFDVPLGSARLD